MITLINSFSPNMLSQSRMTLEWTPISIREIESMLEEETFQSYMGQYNVANYFGKLLNREINVNRKPYYIHPNDIVIQVQYIGPFFEDDAHKLPEAGKIIYWKIEPLELKSSFQDGKKSYLTHLKKGV